MKQKSPLHKTIRYFTIMELLVSMAVFSILVLLLMQVFDSSQRVWSTMSQKTQVKETAMNILNMLETDLKSARPSVGTSCSGFWIKENSAPSQLFFLGFEQELPDSASETDSNEVIRLYETRQIDSSGLYCLFRQTFYSQTNSASFTNLCSGTGTLPSLSSDAVLLASNIHALTIRPYYLNGSSYTAFPTGEGKDFPQKGVTADFPVAVIITLELLDEEMVDTYLDSDTPAAKKTAIDGENMHKFTRIVILNQ